MQFIWNKPENKQLSQHVRLATNKETSRIDHIMHTVISRDTQP